MMLKLSWGLLVFSTLQWPLAYLTGIGSEVWYVTGLSILALQYAAVTAINSAKADKHVKENGPTAS